MDLTVIHETLIGEIQMRLGIVAAGPTVRELGGTIEELSAMFQSLAICHLLKSGDLDLYRENLVRSGQALRYFLSKSAAAGNTDDLHLGISRTESFLDAFAGGDYALAREIARLSADSWHPAREYEDDFCYYQYLHALVLSNGDVPRQPLETILHHFEATLEGATSNRLEFCRALLDRDVDRAHEQFVELMKEIQTALEERKQGSEAYDFLVWPRSFVCVEGLALLGISRIIGLGLESDFPLCPRLAQISETKHNFPDLFAEIDAYLPP